jgi:hypothetical protein
MTTQERLFERIQKNSRDFAAQLAYLRGDERRSALGKQEEIAKLFEHHDGRHRELEQQYRDDLDGRLARSREAAFRYPKVSADVGTDVLLRRDAADRASRASTREELSGLLEAARMSADETLAVAVLQRGYSLQDSQVVGEALEMLPERQEQYRIFSDISEEYNTLEQMGISAVVGAFGPTKPPEIGGRAEQEERGAARGIISLEDQLDQISEGLATSTEPITHVPDNS